MSADAEKDDNYLIIWRVCDKKYVSREGYRKSVSFTVILPIAKGNCLSHYLLACIVAYTLKFVNPFFLSILDILSWLACQWRTNCVHATYTPI